MSSKKSSPSMSARSSKSPSVKPSPRSPYIIDSPSPTTNAARPPSRSAKTSSRTTTPRTSTLPSPRAASLRSPQARSPHHPPMLKIPSSTRDMAGTQASDDAAASAMAREHSFNFSSHGTANAVPMASTRSQRPPIAPSSVRSRSAHASLRATPKQRSMSSATPKQTPSNAFSPSPSPRIAPLTTSPSAGRSIQPEASRLDLPPPRMTTPRQSTTAVAPSPRPSSSIHHHHQTLSSAEQRRLELLTRIVQEQQALLVDDPLYMSLMAKSDEQRETFLAGVNAAKTLDPLSGSELDRKTTMRATQTLIHEANAHRVATSKQSKRIEDDMLRLAALQFHHAQEPTLATQQAAASVAAGVPYVTARDAHKIDRMKDLLILQLREEITALQADLLARDESLRESAAYAQDLEEQLEQTTERAIKLSDTLARQEEYSATANHEQRALRMRHDDAEQLRRQLTESEARYRHLEMKNVQLEGVIRDLEEGMEQLLQSNETSAEPEVLHLDDQGVEEEEEDMSLVTINQPEIS